jgi:DNA-binding NarL/FixJ family response regulator
MNSLNHIRVLIADDHGLIRQGISNVLSNYAEVEIVAEASDGPSLFSALAKHKSDCLLIDITMPDFEPITAVRKIREEYPNVKILIVSAYDDDLYVKGLFAAGANGYHLKSQPLQELKLAIDQVMAGEKWLSSPLVNKLISPSTISKSLPVLTTRQCDLLRLLHQGLDNYNIAKCMNISIKTVENNLTRLYRCLDVQSRLEAVNFAIRHPEVLTLSTFQTPHRNEDSNSNARSAITLLLVDDNAHFRRELRKTINENIISPRATIYEAENISEAVELAERIHPKITLIDMLLGKENGIDATKQIKKHAPESRIILISAYPDREFHRLGIEAGALAFLDKKDLDLSSLRQILGDNSTS